MSKDGGILGSLLPQFKLCLGSTLGSGQQPFPWIHINDIVGIITHSIHDEDFTGVLNGVGPNTVTYSQFASHLSTAVNRPSFLTAPEFSLKLLLGEERTDQLLLGQYVTPERTLKLGYKFRFETLNSALSDILK